MEVLIRTGGKLIRVGIMKEFGDLEHIVDSLQALGILYLQTKRSEQSEGFDALQSSAHSDSESNPSPLDEISNSEGLEKSLEIYNEKATGKNPSSP